MVKTAKAVLTLEVSGVNIYQQLLASKLPLPSRAFGHARGHLRVSRVLLDGPRKKTARGNKEPNLIIKHRIQQNKH